MHLKWNVPVIFRLEAPIQRQAKKSFKKTSKPLNQILFSPWFDLTFLKLKNSVCSPYLTRAAEYFAGG